MKVLILSNGSVKDYTFLQSLVSGTDFFICADGGGMHAYNMGLTPDVLIGDFDSISKEVLNYFREKSSQIISCPSEKDETDTQLAVEYAVSKGASEICMTGSIGSRLDHTYANVGLLVWLLGKGVKGCIKDSSNEVFVTDRYIRLEGKPGDEVSLLALTSRVSGIYTKGLQYKLEDDQLYIDSPRGISNVFTAAEAEITISEGLLLVCRSLD